MLIFLVCHDLSPGVRCQQGAWCPFFLADSSLPTAQQAAGTHGAHQLLSAWFPFRVSQTGSVPALLPILGWFAEWTISLRPLILRSPWGSTMNSGFYRVYSDFMLFIKWLGKYYINLADLGESEDT